ncbi:unnamed protein product [Dimorphilus gyrociliatus]|uniref:Alpha-mannosidase n=1 Tax=Dimorphilus gyrociliatus TaxID=2664684 RepID=A0A7I8VYZ4_9ANNE|nr:unnamed protein product [Dimorphilus gyrociliatus]
MKCARRFIVVCCLVLIGFLLYTLFNKKERILNRSPIHIQNVNSEKINKVTLSKLITTAKLQKKDLVCKKLGHTKSDINVRDIWQTVAKLQSQRLTVNEPSQTYTLGARELHVVVIPHSHSDPGWLKTFDEYVLDQTYQTLQNVAIELERLPNMTFVWAETSFLNAWSGRTEPKNLAKIQKHLESGRLEIVEGGWVVPDQATPSLYGLINQMVEGHSWLRKYLKYTPKNSWALDPFGYSDTHPYIYKLAGYEHMVILRVHSGVKRAIEDKGALHFDWHQAWDSTGKYDMPTHMMPYTLYNIKHTCGPSTDTCLYFDFRQIQGEISESRAEPVTDKNIVSLATKLVDQWSQKAVIAAAGTDPAVVIVPLGDDFRYDRPLEWPQQYNNYMMLFEYINSKKDWKVKAKFGTVADYVSLKKKFMKDSAKKLSGDFFPYADKPLNYWTGYFTTRPALKRLGKVLEYRLRATEILYALTNHNFTKAQSLMNKGRRALGLFMHHDAITGTSRSYVVEDYRHRMIGGLNALRKVAEICMQTQLASKSSFTLLPDPSIKAAHSKQPMDLPITYSVAVFNPIEHKRHAIIEINLKQIHSNLIGDDVVKCQVNPKWRKRGKQISTSEFKLVCLVVLKPLATSTFSLINDNKVSISAIETSLSTNIPKGPFKLDKLEKNEPLVLKGSSLTAQFSTESGLLNSINDDPVNTKVLAYTSSGSGAYLFGAEGPATGNGLSSTPIISVIRGPVTSEVIHSQDVIVLSSRVINIQSDIAKAIHLYNEIDLTERRDREVIVRFETSIKPVNDKSHFFTDLNGFNTVPRMNISQLPLQANFFPATQFAFVESAEGKRFNVLLGQSHAVSSLKNGQIDILLDRSPTEDDGKGLGGGVEDMRPSNTYVTIFFEKTKAPAEPTLSQPSLLLRHLSLFLNNPPLIFAFTENSRVTSSLLKATLPCDVHLLTLRKESANTCLMILQKVPYDCESSSIPKNCVLENSFNLYKMFKGIIKVTSTSLTMIRDYRAIPPKSADLKNMNPMDIFAYKVSIKL